MLKGYLSGVSRHLVQQINKLVLCHVVTVVTKQGIRAGGWGVTEFSYRKDTRVLGYIEKRSRRGESTKCADFRGQSIPKLRGKYLQRPWGRTRCLMCLEDSKKTTEAYVA